MACWPPFPGKREAAPAGAWGSGPRAPGPGAVPGGGCSGVSLVVVETMVAALPEQAYALAKDMESYPQFMKDVVSVRILSEEPGSQTTEWRARLQGKILRWTERDVFDDAACTITYHQVEGDLKRFQGAWGFEAVPGGTRITLSCDFDLGIPMLAGLLDPVARLVIKRSFQEMIAALGARLAATG